jgi:hypothetical protein
MLTKRSAELTLFDTLSQLHLLSISRPCHRHVHTTVITRCHTESSLESGAEIADVVASVLAALDSSGTALTGDEMTGGVDEVVELVPPKKDAFHIGFTLWAFRGSQTDPHRLA